MVDDMDLVEPVSTAIALFTVIVAIGIVLFFFAVWLARMSANFFKGG
jgi:hypothetical protein